MEIATFYWFNLNKHLSWKGSTKYRYIYSNL